MYTIRKRHRTRDIAGCDSNLLVSFHLTAGYIRLPRRLYYLAEVTQYASRWQGSNLIDRIGMWLRVSNFYKWMWWCYCVRILENIPRKRRPGISVRRQTSFRTTYVTDVVSCCSKNLYGRVARRNGRKNGTNDLRRGTSSRVFSFSSQTGWIRNRINSRTGSTIFLFFSVTLTLLLGLFFLAALLVQ